MLSVLEGRFGMIEGRTKRCKTSERSEEMLRPESPKSSIDSSSGDGPANPAIDRDERMYQGHVLSPVGMRGFGGWSACTGMKFSCGGIGEKSEVATLKLPPGAKSSATRSPHEAVPFLPALECTMGYARPPPINRICSSLIGVMQGAEILCSMAVLFLYKDDFKIGPSSLTTTMTVIQIPWAMKPLWAITSDALPILGYRRKSYILIGSLLCTISLLAIGSIGYRSQGITTFSLFCFYFGSAICNVIGEGLVVEDGRAVSSADANRRHRPTASSGGGAAATVSTFFLFRRLSFAIAAYFSAVLLNHIDKQFIFLIAALLPLLVFVVSIFLAEAPEPAKSRTSFQAQLTKLYRVVTHKSLSRATAFIFLFMATPSAGMSVFYYMTTVLKFPKDVLGRMAFLQSLASLGGIICYQQFFTKSSLRRLLLASTLLVAPFCYLPLFVVKGWNRAVGIPDVAFMMTDNIVMEFLGEFMTLPVLVLAAQLCPPGLECSVYSFFLSAYNIGAAVGSLVSAGLTRGMGVCSTDFSNLGLLITICASTTFLPLTFLHYVPPEKDVESRIKKMSANCVEAGPENDFSSLLRKGSYKQKEFSRKTTGLSSASTKRTNSEVFEAYGSLY